MLYKYGLTLQRVHVVKGKGEFSASEPNTILKIIARVVYWPFEATIFQESFIRITNLGANLNRHMIVGFK